MQDRRRTSRSGPVPLVGALVAALATALAGLSRGAAEEGADRASDPVLHLTQGGFVAGAVIDSNTPGTLRWQARAFVEPFAFATDAVNAIHFPVPEVLPRPVGEYGFELSGGDFVFGSLAALDETTAVIETAKLGRLSVRRADLHRMTRWRGGKELVYVGPNGLSDWMTTPAVAEKRPGPRDVRANLDRAVSAAREGWREESGELVSDVEGTAILADLGIPARAAIDIEVSWKSKPDFVIALGVNGIEAAIRQAFRVEVWDGEVVIARETDKEADVASVASIAAGPGRARIHVLLDQPRGRLFVLSPKGQAVAALDLAEPRVKPGSGVYLENKRGSVRIERLRIARWNGEPPGEPTADTATVLRDDGTALTGAVTGFDAASKTFLVQNSSGETRVAEARVSSVQFSMPRDEETQEVRAVLQDGSRLSGALKDVEKGALGLVREGVEEIARLPVAGLRSLIVLRHGQAKPSDAARSPRGSSWRGFS